MPEVDTRIDDRDHHPFTRKAISPTANDSFGYRTGRSLCRLKRFRNRSIYSLDTFDGQYSGRLLESIKLLLSLHIADFYEYVSKSVDDSQR